jgi:hypothetical protein
MLSLVAVIVAVALLGVVVWVVAIALLGYVVSREVVTASVLIRAGILLSGSAVAYIGAALVLGTLASR